MTYPDEQLKNIYRRNRLKVKHITWKINDLFIKNMKF